MNGATQAASPAVREAFGDALRIYRSDRFEDSERLCRQCLAADPRHADSLHLLGVIACHRGANDVAADLIGQAIVINPGEASYHSNLAAVMRRQGRLDQAVICYRNATRLLPGHPQAHMSLGHALREQGRPDEAVATYRTAIGLKPGDPEAHNALAVALMQCGRLDEAASHYRKAVELRPDYADAYNNLGIALCEQRRLDEAAVCYRRALELRSDCPEIHTNLGNVLRDLGRLDEAIACHRNAIALKPDDAETQSNLGLALREHGELEEALGCCRRAVALRPDLPDVHINLGNILRDQNRLDEAASCYRSAIALSPDSPRAHNNLALLLLARGDLAAGWEEFEWRWKTPELIKRRRTFTQPRWHGEAAEGRTLLIHAEQGFGDTLQFCRYGPLAAARGLRVIMEVQKPLVRLLRNLQGIDLVVARGEELPGFDLHCAMLSMPAALRTTMTTIPGTVSYLQADEKQVAGWRTRLATIAGQGPRIGLVWAGSSYKHLSEADAVDRRRSIAPDRLAPWFELPGFHFFSLQKDGPAAPKQFPLTDFMAEMTDFADTAALVANLDLVIAVDTAVAHLAAALGKPVWLMDRFDPCWRWFIGRRDSPWYPTLRLYRQPHPGDWDCVLAEVARDLRSFAARGKPAAMPGGEVAIHRCPDSPSAVATCDPGGNNSGLARCAPR